MKNLKLIEQIGDKKNSILEDVKTQLERLGQGVDLYFLGIEEAIDLEGDFDAALLSPQKVAHFGDKLGPKPLEVIQVGVFDSLFLEEGHRIPRNVTYESLKEGLARANLYLDLNVPAYIFGSGELACVSVGLLSSLGIRDIYVYCRDPDYGNENLVRITRYFFQVSVSCLPLEEITQSPHMGSILVNTLALEAGSEALELLSYFNYLQSNSIVMDLTGSKELELEAKEAHMNYFGKSDLNTFQKMVFARRLGFLIPNEKWGDLSVTD